MPLSRKKTKITFLPSSLSSNLLDTLCVCVVSRNVFGNDVPCVVVGTDDRVYIFGKTDTSPWKACLGYLLVGFEKTKKDPENTHFGNFWDNYGFSFSSFRSLRQTFIYFLLHCKVRS